MTDRQEETILFSWIHLADIQAGHGDPGHRLVLDALRGDIAAWGSWGLPAPGAVFVTGDIAFSGGARDRNEYAVARTWLGEVAGSVGLGPDRVFVVPGNHDVDRTADHDKATVRLVQSLRAGSESLDDILHDPEDRRRLGARIGSYLAFAEGFAPACLGSRAEGDDGLFWMHRFDASGGLRVRLVGLDTALLAADDADRGRLRLGTAQISRGLSDPSIERYGEIVIALGHHPLDGGWLADEKEAAAWLRNYAHVHLHGQVHEAESEAARSGAGGGLVRIGAGGRASGYSFAAVVATESGLRLRIWPRAWSDRTKRFLVDADNVPDGGVFAEHALRVELRPDARELVERRAPLAGRALFEGPGAMPAVPVPDFLGRSAEMDALRRALAPDVEEVCVVASGVGGIGKTTLVRQFVATEARALFPEGAAWIDATSLPSELGRVAQRFGWKRERLPTVEEANQWLANALHDRSVLLVVDNADVDQAKDIPVPGGKCRTLVTSRALVLHGDLGKQVLALPLGKWSDDVCREYLRKVSKRADLADEALDRLARFVGNLPLAVRLIAKLLVRGTAPEKVAAQLEEEPVETLDAVARGADRGVKATFLVAYRELDETERWVLLAMSACARATRSEVVAEIAGVSEVQAERTLMELWEQRSLVEHDAKAERPWGLHDVVRIFLREQEGAESAAERHREFVRAHLETHKMSTEWEAAEREMIEVVQAIEQAIRSGKIRYARYLLNRAAAPMAKRGYAVDAERMFLAIMKVVAPASHDLALMLTNLGVVERALGKLDQAVGHFQMALKYYNGSESLRLLNNLSAAHMERRDIAAATVYAEQATVMAETLNDPERMADCLSNLGLLYRYCREFGKAIDRMRRAYKLYVELNELDGQAKQSGNIGICYADLGEWSRSLECFERALVIARQIGSIEAQATQIANIGSSWYHLGQPAVALMWFGRALEFTKQLKLPDSAPLVRQLDWCIRTVESSIASHSSISMSQFANTYYIAGIVTSNIRAIASLEWKMARDAAPGWHVFLGENGSGKSTLLRAIGLVLIGHEESVALRQAWGTWVRADAEKGHGAVTLACPQVSTAKFAPHRESRSRSRRLASAPHAVRPTGIYGRIPRRPRTVEQREGNVQRCVRTISPVHRWRRGIRAAPQHSAPPRPAYFALRLAYCPHRESRVAS